jgi:hypothetical protein
LANDKALAPMDPTPTIKAVQHLGDIPRISAAHIFRLVAARPMARKDIPQTLARWGVARLERCNAAINHFVGRYRSGLLSGALVLACKR